MSSPIPDRTVTLAPRVGTAATVEVTPAAPREVELDDLAADDPDRYEQVAEHARGGLGRVVRAVDRRLGRTVAVKELLRHDPSNEARFLREAMITARLEHPGIVPVHEAGRWPNGDPYYVMKLVEGRTLKELITEAATIRERLALLSHVIAVADAVGYAHSEGVIHRDLKPSNVIVGAFGETIVVDWGLARDRKRDVPEPSEDMLLAAGSGVSTVSGKVVGTPAYMSPEQARGDTVDERADVYALGAVLYEVLSGTPPHADATPQAVLDRVIAGPPRPVSMVVPAAPIELCTIVRKAMARDPDARYPHANALAEDLRRFTTGKLVSAHSYSTWALLRKKLARHRGVVAVALASMLVLAAGGVASVRRVVAERNIARSQRGLAEGALTSAEKRKRELVLLQAETALPKDPTAALAWLKTYELAPEDRVAVVDVIDEALALGVARHVFRPGDWVYDARFTPDGEHLIAAVRDGVIRSYNLTTGIAGELGQAPSPPEAMVLTADGKTAITGGSTGEVIAWPIAGGAPRTLIRSGGRTVTALELDGHKLRVDRQASAPAIVDLDAGSVELLAPTTGINFAVADHDWSRVAVVSSPTEVAIAEGGARGKLRPLAHTGRAINFLALSPRGDTVLLHDGRTLWSVPFTGGPLHEISHFGSMMRAVAWSPDGKTLALGGDRSEILLVDLATGATSELRGHTDAIYTLQFTRDSARLLSASDDSTARVWSLATGTATVLRGHDDDVYRAWFSPDERSVATSSLDGSTRVWPLDRTGSIVHTEAAAIEGMRLDGNRAIVRTGDTIARWDLATGAREQLFSWVGEPHNLGTGVASPDGSLLAIPASDGSMELRARDGSVRALRGHKGMINHVEFTRDGRTVLSSSADGTLRSWDVASGAGRALITGDVPVRGFAVARDGRIAAQAGDTAFLITPDGHVNRLGRGGAWCVDFAEFEPVRDRLVFHRCDKGLAIFDGERMIEMPTGGYGAGRIAVSPDGTRLAAGLSDRTVRIWDASTGQVLDVLRGHSDLVMDVAWSPDGTRLASAAYDRTIRLWDVLHKWHRVLRGHTGPVLRVGWRGLDRLVSASQDGTLRDWPVPALPPPSGDGIRRQLEAATTARIDLDRPATSAARGS